MIRISLNGPKKYCKNKLQTRLLVSVTQDSSLPIINKNHK